MSRDAHHVFDLFAGPGGWDEGLRILGRTDVIGVEWDAAACATARAAGHARVGPGDDGDVSLLDPVKFADAHLGGRAEGGISSPPCQGFSTTGLGLGRGDTPMIMSAVEDVAAGVPVDFVVYDLAQRIAAAEGDPRSALVLEPLRWALALRPEWLAWEQVPPVLPLWKACGDVLRAAGYSVAVGNVKAERYGVPQTRTRAVLLASRVRRVELPRPTCSAYYPRDPSRLEPDMPRWRSMREALTAAGLPLPGEVLRSNYGTGGDASNRGERRIDDPAPTVTSKIDRNRWLFAGVGATSQTTAGQIPRDLDAPAHTITGKGTAAWVYRGSNQAHAARRPLDTPAPTVNFAERCNKVEWMPEETAGDIKASGLRVTVAEAAVFQTFRPDYPFAGTKGDQFRQVGDAVPPLLAAHLLAAVGAGELPDYAR